MKSFKRQLLYFALLAISQTNGRIQINIIPDNGEIGVDIYFQDMLVFQSRRNSPIFTVGLGSTTYDETQGAFVYNDTISEQIDVTSPFEIQTDDDGTYANITFTDDSALSNILLSLSVSSKSLISADATMQIRAKVRSTNPAYNRLWMSVVAEALETEKVFGGGEQFTYFNLRGHDFPIFTTEQGVGRDDGVLATGANAAAGGAGGDYYTTYWPQASYVALKSTGDKYSLLLNNRNYLVLNFTADSYHQIYSHSLEISGSMLYSTSVKSLVSSISENVGRQPMLPDWIMKGAILGVQNGTEQVKLHYNMAKAAGVNISGLWIQDWSGSIETDFGHRVYWNWEWNSTYYPGLDTFIEDLSAEDIYVTVYCNMHLINGSKLYQEADQLGHFMKASDGTTFLQDFGDFFAGTIDLLNEDAKNWYADKLEKNMIGLGLKGWMADFGEYTDLKMISNNSQGYTPEEVHNLIPVAWAETNRNILENSDNVTDAVFWTRSGGLGSGNFTTLAWNGDQNVDFSYEDGLPSTIVATLNLAMSGIGLCHFDIGGYTTFPSVALRVTRTPELLLRSAEYAVFTPVMRTHEGNHPEENEQFYSSQETIIAFARLTQMHSRLFNYTKELVKQNAEKGIPVQRPMFYEFEADLRALDIWYQYMYGPDLIVAPALEEDQTVVPVYVPYDGTSKWIHIWGGLGSDKGPFSGNQTVNISAPLGFPAVLYNRDSQWAYLFEQMGEEFGPSPPYMLQNIPSQ